MNKQLDEIYTGMCLERSTSFKPGIYALYGQNGISVTRSNIVLDMAGVVLYGGLPQGRSVEQNAEIHQEFSYSDDKDEAERVAALGYRGIALTLRDVRNVTVRGLSAKGFELAVLVENCENITIEGCNFSENFHDVECGWNEHGPRGGILLLGSHRCTIRHNRANNVWNGVCLKYAHHNLIQHNDFSYCSNMCVKMWNACHNVIDSNNLSWGLRIKPGEVHARDSAGLLMESGCDYNIVRSNDLTHGGDGIFIRVLNGWHSRFNFFENNDCSYANNNAIEAWSNSNTYLRNKANYSSYGFWMGGSDDTLMMENEAAYNGDGFRNAPESFGNAGVAIVGGSGTHFRLIGNHIHHNCGPGVAVRFTKQTPVRHMILEDNHIHDNADRLDFKGHGIYLRNAAFLSLSNNSLHHNQGQDLCLDGNVSDLFQLEDGDAFVQVTAQFPKSFAHVGDALSFGCTTDAEANVRWDFGDGSFALGNSVTKQYNQPGTYYVGVTASTASRSDMGGKVLNIMPKGLTLDVDCSFYSLTGNSRSTVMDLAEPVSIDGLDSLTFFMSQQCEADTDWEQTVKSPIITLVQDDNNRITITPVQMTSDFLFNDTNKTWEKVLYRHYCLPIRQGTKDFVVETVGCVRTVNRIECQVLHKNQGRFQARIKGITFHTAPPAQPPLVAARNRYPQLFDYPRLSAHSQSGFTPQAILGDNSFCSDCTGRWVAADADSGLTVEFGREVELDTVKLWLYQSSGDSQLSMGEVLPARIHMQAQMVNGWKELGNWETAGASVLTLGFKKVCCSAIRLLPYQKGAAVWKLEAGCVGQLPAQPAIADPVVFDSLRFKLNIERNAQQDCISDLLVQLYRCVDKQPAGAPIYTGVLAAQSVEAGGINILPLGGLRLAAGDYAVSFTQQVLAKSRTQGAYYRLPNCKSHNGQAQGILSPEGCKDETDTWGTIWLQLVSRQGVLDLSHDGEAVGVRAGFTESPARYQTFTVDSTLLRR